MKSEDCRTFKENGHGPVLSTNLSVQKADMAAEDAVLRQDQNGIARIVLNRPETLNAMNMDLLQRLSTTLEEVRSDHAVKAVIITGAGNDAFSAGADIKFVVQL